MLKVGDKVKVKEDLERGQRRGSHYYYFIAEAMCKYKGKIVTVSKINVSEQYLLIEEDDNRWKWTEDMFDKIEEDNNMKELTFKEVITNIKEDEVWESNDISIFKTKDDISIDWKNGGDNGVLIFDDEKFKLKRKQYNFEEAFKFFEKGKEIESVVSRKCFKIRDSVSVYITKDKTINTVNDEIRLFTHNEIRGQMVYK